MQNMARIFFIGINSIFLAACGITSTTTLFKPGATHVQKQHDLDQCKIASLHSIPQAFTTVSTGGFYDLGDIQCYPIRQERMMCTRYGSGYTMPRYFSVDQNQGLRWRFMMECLQKKGYDIVNNLRACTTQEERSHAIAARTISAVTCNPDTQLDY
ncbi:MAG: hypothetical protein JSC188_000550 [Candidatus Tokpelaia sp. JSC188]|nr:MAG: hypothetical protein JSC188_000550 [Candidatus Tokpelaia sp. JSC188]